MRKWVLIVGCLAMAGSSSIAAAKVRPPEKCSRNKARPANPYGSVLVPAVQASEPVDVAPIEPIASAPATEAPAPTSKPPRERVVDVPLYAQPKDDK